MELTVDKQIIRMKEEIKTEMQEHPIDSELILPDFCPDIARILKCKGEPKIFTKQIANGMMTIEGAVAVGLLYVEEDGSVSFYNQNLPFYHEMPVPEETDSAYVIAKMDYCNCRAVNARKVEIRGAVSMRVTLSTFKEVPVVTGAAGSGVELLCDESSVTTLLAVCEKNLTVTDEIQISSGSIRSILRSSAIVRDGEFKAVTGKTVVKANLELSALYRDADGGYETLRAQIPFTQIMDMEGVEEDADCRLRFDVTGLELRTRTGLDGECKNVMVTAGITVGVEATKTLTLPMVTDGYSTRCGLGIRRYGGNLQRLTANLTDTQFFKKQVELGREITSVLDLWCDISADRIRNDGDSLLLSGVLTLMLLAIDSDGVPVYLEKAMDYTWDHPAGSAGAVLCAPEVTVQSLSFTLTGDSMMDVRAELQVCASLYEQLSINVVSDLAADLSVSPPEPSAPLILYYAGAGERLFDIARRYNTTCHAIAAANNLTETVLSEKKALLIPVM